MLICRMALIYRRMTSKNADICRSTDIYKNTHAKVLIGKKATNRGIDTYKSNI